MAINYMTKEGYDALVKEIEQLEKVERRRISGQIAEAKEKGDLSENAEYDAAKEAQGMLEMKIAKLKNILGDSRILDETKVDLSNSILLDVDFRLQHGPDYIEADYRDFVQDILGKSVEWLHSDSSEISW